MRIGGALFGVLVCGSLAVQPLPARAQERTFLDSPCGPTVEDYLQQAGPDAKLVPEGTLKIDGWKVNCGKRPTILDEKLDDYGAAYPGFLILNPKLLDKTSPAVKLWIHAHECGHQFRGPDEETADCFAVQRGRRQGWLTAEGLEEVAKAWNAAHGNERVELQAVPFANVMATATTRARAGTLADVMRSLAVGGQIHLSVFREGQRRDVVYALPERPLLPSDVSEGRTLVPARTGHGRRR